ncbi:hypothetical protein DAHU10_024600 [Hanseniaspora uvarum]|nr:hypothetical protein DAHU10_024600 [Hanseniaspora uvarum]
MSRDIIEVAGLIEEYYRTNCSNAYIQNEIENYTNNNDVIPLCKHLLELNNDIALNSRYHGIIILNQTNQVDDNNRLQFLLIALKEYSIHYLLRDQTIFSVLNKLIESVMRIYINNKEYYDVLGLIITLISNDLKESDLSNKQDNKVINFANASIRNDRLILLMVKILLEEMINVKYEEASDMILENNIALITEFNLNLIISNFSNDYSAITDLVFDISTVLINFDKNLTVLLLRLMTIDETNYKYTDSIINIFYNFIDDNSKVDYNTKYMIELYFNPTTILTNHEGIDVSFIDSTFIIKYIQYLISNKLLNELSKLSLFYTALLENSNEILLKKILLGEDVNKNLTFVLSLMDLPLVPIEEEQFSSNLLSFWNDFVDNLISNNNMQYNQTLNKLILIFFKKLSLINYDNNAEFINFRFDSIELIKSMWDLLGNSFVYDILNELLLLRDEVDYFQFENYINILNNVINFDDKILNLLKMNNYSIISKVFESIKLICQTDSNLSVLMTKTFTTFLNKISDFLDNNTIMLINIVNTLLDLIFNRKLPLQIERTLLLLLSDLVSNSSNKLQSFIPTFEMILSDTMKSDNLCNDNVIITINNLYGCLIASVNEDPETKAFGDYDYTEIGNNIIANANNYLLMIGNLLDDNNPILILKCIKSFLNGLNSIDKEKPIEDSESKTSILPAVKEYVKNSFAISEVLLNLLNASFILTEDTSIAILQAWFDIFVFIISNKIFKINMENILKVLTIKLYQSNLIDNVKIFEKVLEIFQQLVKNNYINTLYDFKVIYYTLIINNEYKKNNLINIINKDLDLLETYYNILSIVITDHSASLIPNSNNYTIDDDISALLIIQTIKDYQKRNEKFILVAISKFLSKLFNNKKFNAYQNQLVNEIFKADGNFLSYSNIIKISFMKILNTNGDFDYIIELIRNIINKHKMLYKKWLEMVISDQAFIDQCLLLNKDIGFVKTTNNMLVKKIQVCNGSRKIISVVNDWYKGLLR